MTTPKLDVSTLTAEEQNNANFFLDVLRESGVTNMYGARAYVEREFGWNERKASAALVEWMRTFSERHPR